MSVSAGDKLVKKARVMELFALLTKKAFQDDSPSLVERGLQAAEWGGNASDMVNVAHSARNVAQVARSGYQGARALGSAAASPWASGAMGTASKVIAPISMGLSGLSTASSIGDQYQASKDFRGTGKSYITSEQGLYDTANTVGNSLPLIGGAIGTAVGGPVGTAAGAAIGGVAQLGVNAGTWAAKGMTGYDPEKRQMAKDLQAGRGFNNAGSYVMYALNQGDRNKAGISKNWFGSERDYKKEELSGYLNKQRAAMEDRSLTNKGQVA